MADPQELTISRGADAGANSIIANLAQRMGTTAANGTTIPNMVAGLDGYLEANAAWNAPHSGWRTSAVLNTDPGMTAQILWDYMKDELHACEDVLPLISWPNGPPVGQTGGDFQYDQPEEGSPPGTMDHAMTMVGFDDRIAGNESIYVNDPANNLIWPWVAPNWRATHNWPGEYSKYAVTINNATNTIDFQIFGVTASIYGVVTASPIPEPATLALLGLGLALIRRRP